MTALSICIPTFNRANLLLKCLESILSQITIDILNDVEVVISDNSSSDATEELCRQLEDRFPRNIRYFRHKENVGAEDNFYRVLCLGRGEFLKGLNDSLVLQPGSIVELLRIVKACNNAKPALCFLNGALGYPDLATESNTIDLVVRHASYFITWWGGFGTWREHLGEEELFFRKRQTAFVHVDNFLRQVHSSQCSIVINEHLFNLQTVAPKSGYNVAEVFGRNYIGLLKPYVESGDLSPETLEAEKRKLLVNHILPYHFNLGFNNNFLKDEHTLDYLSDFQTLPDFVELYKQAEALRNDFQPPATEQITEQKDIPIEDKQSSPGSFSIVATPDSWRAANTHNLTKLVKPLRCPYVSVGNFSYGDIDLYEFDHCDEGLHIGHFVSIAPEVKFLLGGNHSYTGFSTYPFAVLLFGQLREAKSKGIITIQDDVWIGLGATILSGVTIGQGAVIGARCVVSKDIPPYAIACGNPVSIVKYRFSPAVIKKLLLIDFSSVDSTILGGLGLEKIYNELNEQNVDEFIALLPKKVGQAARRPGRSGVAKKT